jgi:hypothetical protein
LGAQLAILCMSIMDTQTPNQPIRRPSQRQGSFINGMPMRAQRRVISLDQPAAVPRSTNFNQPSGYHPVKAPLLEKNSSLNQGDDGLEAILQEHRTSSLMSDRLETPKSKKKVSKLRGFVNWMLWIGFTGVCIAVAALSYAIIKKHLKL